MIHTYLDLSTGHLTQDTMNRVERAAELDLRMAGTLDGWPAMSIGSYREGVFMTVPDQKEQDLSGLPGDLAAVMRYAQRAGVYVVRFDSDGDTVADLPYFEET